MNLNKAVGLSLAVVAVAAIVGVGSATATTLCKKNENPCSFGQRYPEKETILAGIEEGTGLKYEAIEAGGAVVFSGECQEASISWSTIKNLGPGKILTGTVTAMLFGKCKIGMTACEAVVAENLPYTAELVPQVGGNGRAFLVNGAGGARKFKFQVCGLFGQSCVYEPAKPGEPGETPLNLIGGNPAASITVLWEVKAEGGNPLCGEKVKMQGTYTVAVPKPLWVEKEP